MKSIDAHTSAAYRASHRWQPSIRRLSVSSRWSTREISTSAAPAARDWTRLPANTGQEAVSGDSHSMEKLKAAIYSSTYTRLRQKV